jgi:hypothetical protein
MVCPKIFKKREILGQMMTYTAVLFIVGIGVFAAISVAAKSDIFWQNPANIVETNIRMDN